MSKISDNAMNGKISRGEAAMALQFISGTDVSERTGILYDTICRKARSDLKQRYIFIVPEQQTLQVQRGLIAAHPDHVLGNIDVLSFARLAYRVLSEQRTPETVLLDDTGKSMILRRLAGKRKDSFELFGRNISQNGFISELKSVISELSAYRVSTDMLESVLSELEGRPALKKKIKDICLIYDAFRQELGDRYSTAEELMSLLAKNIPNSELVKDSIIILDGFTGFTPLQYLVLEQLMLRARHVVCVLTEDEDARKGELFAMSRQLRAKLAGLAKAHGILCDKKYDKYIGMPESKSSDELVRLKTELFAYPVRPCGEKPKSVHIYRAENSRKELEFVLKRTLELVREGYCYRDLAVVAGDLEGCRAEAERIFSKAGIPFFIDMKKSLAANPLVRLITETLTVVEENMSYDAVMAFLKNPCIRRARLRGCTGEADEPMWTEEILDTLDNYLLAGGIGGYRRWEEQWIFSYDTASEEQLSALNELRKTIYGWFFELKKSLTGDHTVREAVTSLFLFLKDFKVYETAVELSEEFKASGEFYLESEYSQAYGKVVKLLEQTVELMGEMKLSIKELREILETGLQELKVGFIPATVDRLVIGDPVRTRLDNIKILFIIGANDGKLPVEKPRSGIITDYDRELLKRSGLELAPTAREDAFNSQYYMYLLLTKPTSALYISYSEFTDDAKPLRPSHIISMLKRVFPGAKSQDSGECYPGMASLTDRREGFSLLARSLRGVIDGDSKPNWRELYDYYYNDDEFAERLSMVRDALFYSCRIEKLDSDTAKRLFGNRSEISISRLEKYAGCAYAHFLTYGLRLKERKLFELQATDYGTLFHAAVSNFFSILEKKGIDWRSVTPEQRNLFVEQSVKEALDAYKTTIFDSSARNKSMADRIKRMTDRTLWALSYQWDCGEYSTTKHETGFGDIKGEAVQLELRDGMRLILNGRIDRIDTVSKNGCVYVKVIDYKTGATKLDISKVYYGLQLQLILYMAAALSREKNKAGGDEALKIVPAGVYYYNMKDPIVDGFNLDKEERERRQLKELRMNGLTNSDAASMRLIDTEGGRVVTGLEYKKDGEVSSRATVGSTKQLEALCRYGKRKALWLAQSIFDGEIRPEPYEYAKQSPCDYCEFNAVCGFDLQTDGCNVRRLARVSRETVWEKTQVQNEGEED